VTKEQTHLCNIVDHLPVLPHHLLEVFSILATKLAPHESMSLTADNLGLSLPPRFQKQRKHDSTSDHHYNLVTSAGKNHLYYALKNMRQPAREGGNLFLSSGRAITRYHEQFVFGTGSHEGANEILDVFRVYFCRASDNSSADAGIRSVVHRHRQLLVLQLWLRSSLDKSLVMPKWRRRKPSDTLSSKRGV